MTRDHRKPGFLRVPVIGKHRQPGLIDAKTSVAAYGSAVWDTQSVLFDGVRDWASSSYNSDLWGNTKNMNLEWSYSWWIRKQGDGLWPSNQHIIGRWSANINNTWRCFPRTSGRMTFYIALSPLDTGACFAEILTPPSGSGWNHYTLCYSGSTGTSSLALSQSILQCYVNGVQASLSYAATPMPATSSEPTIPPPLTLARGQTTALVYWTSGAMDEVCYFNRRLLPQEASDVYNSGSVKDVRTITSVSGALKGYWAMGEGHTTNTIPNLLSGSVMTLMNNSGSVPTGATGSIEDRYTLSAPGNGL